MKSQIRDRIPALMNSDNKEERNEDEIISFIYEGAKRITTMASYSFIIKSDESASDLFPFVYRFQHDWKNSFGSWRVDINKSLWKIRETLKLSGGEWFTC